MPFGIDLLHTLPRFGGTADAAFKPGLDRMRALLDAMDLPHEAFRSVHVAGTNGKGSTASMIASIATSSGINTGLHTSPELLHVTDLMRVNGTPASTEWLDESVRRYEAAIREVEPSFFEASVALSFLHFAERGVDLAVVEVGLGGRLDATNVLSPDVCVITSIDLEHTALLGDTLAAIAREKASIIKPGTPCITGVGQPEALAVTRDVAAENDAPLHVLDEEVSWDVERTGIGGSVLDLRTPLRRLRGLRVALPGAHQHRNAALAVRAAELVLPEADDAPVRTGLADVRRLAGLRGRLEVVGDDPLILTDTAHNPSSLEATLRAVSTALHEDRDRAWSGQLWIALGLLKDKDLTGVVRELAAADAVAGVWPLRLDTDRARPAEDTAGACRDTRLSVREPTAPAGAVQAFREAAAPGDALLATGSHAVVAAVLRAMDSGA